MSAVLVAGLTGCGSAPKGPPPDQNLDLHLAAGGDAMALARYDEAVGDYRHAYRQALVRDDPGSIATAGIDVTIALTAAGHPTEALAASHDTRTALALRGPAPPPPELDLAEAAALLRLGRAAEAAMVTARAETAPDPGIAARAAFLRGLAADRLGDIIGLAAALTRLGDPKKPTPTRQADRLELQARLSLAEGQPAAALRTAEEAAAIRRMSLDYRAMRRALGVAAAAASRAGQPAEAAALAAQIRDSTGAGDAITRSTMSTTVDGPPPGR
jgi:hypothetical protein